ncbi:hypothetical protein KEM55_004958 [Ascosphaera atra]|nr:hypothetical protein KEM55_004958 [Ascosphaera atra]
MHHAHGHQHQGPHHPRAHLASLHAHSYLHARAPAEPQESAPPAEPISSSRSSPNSGNYNGISQSTIDGLIALLVLILVSIIAVGTLLFYRHRQRSRSTSSSNSEKGSRRGSSTPKGELPLYEDVVNEKGGTQQYENNRNTVTISASNGRLQKESTYLLNNGNGAKGANGSKDAPPPSEVPEIRITFPEEEDDQGKPVSGRVVVVRIGESGGIGLEPLDDKGGEINLSDSGDDNKKFEKEGLPSYEGTRFESLDLERIGGLKEKEEV